jgi:DNA-binding Xre family transcriptional regulator
MIFYLNNPEKYDIIFWGIFYMDADYRKLWKLLIDKGIKNRTDLIKMAGISTNILAKLGKGEFISMDSMQKICKALDCDVRDICVMNEKSSVENE